jgi:acylphosphatase
MSPAIRRVHIQVSGRVQGVFFRKYARKQAVDLGLSGWVRNLPDGSVETEAEGLSEAVDRFVAWCSHGPELARVDQCSVTEIPVAGTRSFEIL